MNNTIRVKKIKNFETIIPKKSAFTIDTPDDIPKLNTLLVLSGKRGGGKGVAITTYVKKLMDLNLIDRVILISPTYWSNKTIFEPLNINEETDIIEPTRDAVKTLVELVEKDKDEYDEYLKKKKMYQKYKKMMASDTPLWNIEPDLMMEFLAMGFFEEAPKWKYLDDTHPPRIFAIFDDIMGTEIMKQSSGLVNLCIKHRHIAKGLGISIALLVQSYCAIGGIPRPIRENATLLALFKCKDAGQIEKIHSEIGADVDLEQFDKMFKYATDKPYGFLVIDFSPKSPDKMFRSGWNEYLSML
jgi:hypothetical protein